MTTKYTRLQLKVSDKVDISLIRYDVTVVYESLSSKPTSKKPHPLGTDQTFDEKGYSKAHPLSNRKVKEIMYYIKDVKGNLIKKVTAKALTKKGLASGYKLKTTKASVMKDPKNNKIVGVDKTEVAWYLVKKQESVESFLTRIYIKPYRKDVEEVIFRANNPHLKGDPVLNLYPGDIVVLSNTSNDDNVELAKMKKEAKAAMTKFAEVKKEFGFNAESFAYNADALQGMLMQADYVALTKDPIKTLDKPSGNINLAAIAAGTSQGIVTFYEHSNELVQKNYAKIYKAMEHEKSKGSKLANPKNYKLFRKKYAKLFKNYDHAFSQEFFKFETGIQTNSLRKQIDKNVFARPHNYKGGIPAYTDNLRNMGKISRFTYLGGNVLIGVGAAQAYMNIEDARKTGDSDHITKTAITETLKFGGSVGGGYYGSVAGAAIFAVAFGVSTGGLGFVVLGAGAVIGGTIGGLVGSETGEFFGERIGDKVNQL